MIKFDYKQFAIEKRVDRIMVSNKVGIPYKTLCLMWNRGTLKMETLNMLEKEFGKLSKFIK